MIFVPAAEITAFFHFGTPAAEQVHVLASFEGAHQCRVLEERAVFDRLVDAHEVLEQDASRADREVSDFAVAHLSGRQPDCLA